MAFYVVNRLDNGYPTIDNNRKIRLVEAPNQAAALRHCARSEYSVRVASQQDLVSLLSTDKIALERVNDDADAS